MAKLNRRAMGALALGFSLGGFFDGILLHQILQWHHLLSGLEQARLDISFLILTDGLFHGLMYVVAITGLYLLWTSRAPTTQSETEPLLARAMIGFGIWHLVDAVLSHWVLGIHRVRMDVEQPLLWDLSWLAVFGLLSLATGYHLMKRRTGSTSFLCSPVALVLATLIAGSIASFPAPRGESVIVLLRPGTSETAMMAGLDAVDGRLVWTDRSSKVWAIDVPADAELGRLYGYGALLVSNSNAPVGCLNWIRMN
ncbi:hypothetical protein GCM10010924_39640 [Rhizobium wenxiniae]|uniref:Putative membrane protein n=1 Tax=Rhizobium wenxiniae TaxID=1737357 RepID=A0A7W9Y9Q2_9HYPH|nr:DUF2243 domain-containing protein [Rhizobium wenxiniae]MBB6164625.1 putative membrane protein [Rhizobium wenxiniae]GGG06960.1 hypothetical protein GCM10010924_39640 [Rhizobium wenxiniae]